MVSSAPLASAEAIGLPDSAMAVIQMVLDTYPDVEAAILYGSRALGRHSPAIRRPALLDHIQRAGVLLYQCANPPDFPA